MRHGKCLVQKLLSSIFSVIKKATQWFTAKKPAFIWRTDMVLPLPEYSVCSSNQSWFDLLCPQWAHHVPCLSASAFTDETCIFTFDIHGSHTCADLVMCHQIQDFLPLPRAWSHSHSFLTWDTNWGWCSCNHDEWKEEGMSLFPLCLINGLIYSYLAKKGPNHSSLDCDNILHHMYLKSTYGISISFCSCCKWKERRRSEILCFRAEITNRSQKHQRTFILVMFHVPCYHSAHKRRHVHTLIHKPRKLNIFCLSFQTFKIWTKQTQKMKNMKTKWSESKKRCLNRSRKKQRLYLQSPNENGICIYTNTCVHAYKHIQLYINKYHQH